MTGKLKAKWRSWWELPDDQLISEEQLTRLSINKLHVLMMGIVLLMDIAFLVISFFMETPQENSPIILSIPVTILNYYLLYKKGHVIASKLLNGVVVISLITVETMMNGIQNGDLVLMIPVMVGALMVFQADQRKYGFFLVGIALFTTVYLMVTDRRIYLDHPNAHVESHAEYILNLTAACLATVLQLSFLISVNHRLLDKSIKATGKLRFINDALSSAIKNNEKQTRLISAQLEEIRKADLELKKLSLIATKTANGVMITDKEGRLEWVNHSFEKTTGYHLNEVIGKKPREILQRGEVSPESKLISEKLRSKEFVETTILNYTKDNKPYYNHLEITPVFDEEGNHTHFIALQRDITAEMNYLKEIEKLKNNYELVVAEVTNDFIYEWDLKGDKYMLGKGLDDIFDSVQVGGQKRYVWKLENIHPDDKDRLLDYRKSIVPQPATKMQLEYRYRDKNGKYRIFFDRAYIKFSSAGEPSEVIGAISDITERKRIEAELLEQQIKEQKLIAQIAIQSQEKEKNRIAAELHENINQILATSKMYLDLYKSEHNTSDKFFIKSQEGIDSALEEIRKISHALAAPFADDYDLMDAIHELLDQHLKGDSISIRVVNEIPKDLVIPGEIKLTLYRILQEQIQNVHAYAEANSLELKFHSDRNSIDLCICDDGKGFDVEKMHTGLGLKTINSRVAIHNGTMKLNSQPGKGCKLQIHLPLSKQGNLF